MTNERATQIIAELLKRTPLNVAEIAAAELALQHLSALAKRDQETTRQDVPPQP